MRNSIIRGLFIALYLLFHFWYGGNSNPISKEEGDLLMKNIKNAQSAEDYSDIQLNFESAIQRDDGKEFYMINLETEKLDPNAKSADLSYAKLVLPMLIKRGSFPIYVGSFFSTIIGDFGKGITRVAIVRYRSLRDFLDMNADPDMVKGAPFKFASLQHTEVFATKPTISLLTIRTTFAGLLFLAYLLVQKIFTKV